MWKLDTTNQRVALVISVAVAAVTGPTATVAGPGCMSGQQQMVRGYYPNGHMMPRAAYRPGPPPAYAVTAPYRGMMTPHQRPMTNHRSNPWAVAQSASPSPNEVSTVKTSEAASDAASETVTVRIDGMRFEPASITVKPGTKVTWIHGGSMPHTISGDAGGLRSSTLYRGQKFSHTFDGTGRYDYFCDFHPAMKGSVIVETTGRDT